jgi:hypothetical protein
MPSVAVRAHHSVSTHRFRRPGSRCPAVGVQAVRCPVIWLPRPGFRCLAHPVSSLSGVQPVWCPAVWCPAVRPVASVSSRVSPAVALGTPRCDGATFTTGRVEFHAVRPRPSGSVDGPSRPGCGQRCGVVWRPAGSVGRGPGRVVFGRGGCGRPTWEARPPRGASRRWRRTRAGEFAEARRSRTTAWLRLGLEPRLRCVVVVKPDAGVNGPGRAMSLTARMDARPQRGPAR